MKRSTFAWKIIHFILSSYPAKRSMYFFFLNTQGQGRLVCGVAGYKGHGGQVVKVMQLQESPYCKPLTGSCEVTESLRERKEH